MSVFGVSGCWVGWVGLGCAEAGEAGEGGSGGLRPRWNVVNH